MGDHIPGVSETRRSCVGEPTIGSPSIVTYASKTPDVLDLHSRRYEPLPWSLTWHSMSSTCMQPQSTFAPPVVHRLPILSRACIETLQPELWCAPTTPWSGRASAGSTLERALAGPAVTRSRKGDPGSAHDP